MEKKRTICAAILLAGCLTWIGCDEGANRTGNTGGATSGERGAAGNPQGPAGPSDAQKNAR